MSTSMIPSYNGMPLLSAKRLDMPFVVANGWAAMTGQRLDANESAAFARQLEYIFTETYDVLYPENHARKIFPVESRVAPWHETFTYRTWDQKGDAAVVNNFGKDFPSVEGIAYETTQKIKSLGDAYSYSIQEMRAAAGAGIPLDVKKAQAARDIMERLFERIAWLGDANSGLFGLLNAPGVPGSNKSVTSLDGTTVSAPAAMTAANAWWTLSGGNLVQAPGMTPAGVVADVQSMFASIFRNSHGVHTADCLLVDTGTLAFLQTTPAHPTYNSDSLMKFLMDSIPTLKRIEWSPYLETANGNGGVGTKARIAALECSPRVLSLIVPQEFEQFAPQPVNMAFHVPCHMRTGGIEVRYPKAIQTMDGVQS